MSDTGGERDRWLETGGPPVRYRVLGGAGRARVLVLPGFTEFIEKHEGTLRRLGAMGLDRLILDWPGQGLSGRLSPARPDLVHCDGFEGHLAALRAVSEREGFLDGSRPLFLFGHSMGGHLALRMAERTDAPVAGIVLIAPMMMPPALPPRLVLAAARAMCGIGLAGLPVAGRQGKARDEVFRPGNPLTRDPAGYRLQVDWWNRNPGLRTLGPSFGWIRAAYASCIATTGNPEWLRRIKVPVEAHVAGDEVVVSSRHIARMLPEIADAAIHRYEGARHELLLEIPEVTGPLWERVGAFIAGRIGAGD